MGLFAVFFFSLQDGRNGLFNMGEKSPKPEHLISHSFEILMEVKSERILYQPV